MIEALLQAERMLIHGMVDQAERIYVNAVESDPRNAIAVVGLARVALEHGDERLAYDRACSALEIDPHNAAALRLEARLSEVFAARGEEVARPAFAAATEPEARAQPPRPVPVDVATQEEATQVLPSASPEARPSEQFVFTRNPTMAEHQQMEEQRRERAGQPAAEQPAAEGRLGEARLPSEAAPGEKRPGFLRRLWSRDR